MKKENRTERILIRLSPTELAHIKENISGLSDVKFRNGTENFSASVRNLLLSRSNFTNESLEKQMKNLNYEVRKIGTNINQIAKKINAGFGTPQDVQEVLASQEKLKIFFASYEKEVNELWESQSCSTLERERNQ